MATHIRTDEISQDLFEDPPVTHRQSSALLDRTPTELRSARALSRTLHRQKTRREKKHIVHLICLNLITMLRHGPGG